MVEKPILVQFDFANSGETGSVCFVLQPNPSGSNSLGGGGNVYYAYTSTSNKTAATVLANSTLTVDSSANWTLHIAGDDAVVDTTMTGVFSDSANDWADWTDSFSITVLLSDEGVIDGGFSYGFYVQPDTNYILNNYGGFGVGGMEQGAFSMDFVIGAGGGNYYEPDPSYYAGTGPSYGPNGTTFGTLAGVIIDNFANVNSGFGILDNSGNSYMNLAAMLDQSGNLQVTGIVDNLGAWYASGVLDAGGGYADMSFVSSFVSGGGLDMDYATGEIGGNFQYPDQSQVLPGTAYGPNGAWIGSLDVIGYIGSGNVWDQAGGSLSLPSDSDVVLNVPYGPSDSPIGGSLNGVIIGTDGTMYGPGILDDSLTYHETGVWEDVQVLGSPQYYTDHYDAILASDANRVLSSIGGNYIGPDPADVKLDVEFGVVIDHTVYEGGIGTYNPAPAAVAAQLATDVAAVNAGKGGILTTTTILSVQGTFNDVADDAAVAAAQLATDQAVVAGHVADIKAGTMILGTTGTYVLLTVTLADGSIQLIRGDDYSDDPVAIAYTGDFNLAGATIRIEAKAVADSRRSFNITGAKTGTAGNYTLAFAIPDTTTSHLLLGPNEYSFDIVATVAGEDTTIMTGTFSVVE